MKTIFKYELEIEKRSRVFMPKGAKVMCVHVDPKTDRPCVWAFVDTSQKLVERFFKVVGTGFPTEYVNEERYIGTFFILGGEFIGHVFYD